MCLALSSLTLGGCAPDAEPSSGRSLIDLSSGPIMASILCKEALEDRLGEQYRSLGRLSDLIRRTEDGRFTIRSVLDVLDQEDERILRSRFRCQVEPHYDDDGDFLDGKVRLTIAALDHPRRHALWPWPWSTAADPRPASP